VETEELLFDYRIPHDHNFTFLTVGLWGPGYLTRIYGYRREALLGIEGEKAGLELTETTTLPRGKVMVWRAFDSVHVQAPPEKLSVSLNLIVQTPQHLARDQYLFDIERNVISGIDIPMPERRRVDLCQVIGAMGDASSVEALSAIASTHPHPRTRIAAYGAWASLAGSDVWSKATADRHPLVREASRGPLEGANR
jgi:hypothetical protein